MEDIEELLELIHDDLERAVTEPGRRAQRVMEYLHRVRARLFGIVTADDDESSCSSLSSAGSDPRASHGA